MPQTMILVSAHDDQAHAALACQSNDLLRWPALANFDPGGHVRPQFAVGKLLNRLARCV